MSFTSSAFGSHLFISCSIAYNSYKNSSRTHYLNKIRTLCVCFNGCDRLHRIDWKEIRLQYRETNKKNSKTEKLRKKYSPTMIWAVLKFKNRWSFCGIGPIASQYAVLLLERYVRSSGWAGCCWASPHEIHYKSNRIQTPYFLCGITNITDSTPNRNAEKI